MLVLDPNQLAGLRRDSRTVPHDVRTKLASSKIKRLWRIWVPLSSTSRRLPYAGDLEKVLAARGGWTSAPGPPRSEREQYEVTSVAQPAFEEIVEDFDFLEDWEDRYRYVIDRGKAMEALDDALKVPATKVDGCASQVWLHPRVETGRFSFEGDSDAMIVRGLIAVLKALYNDVPVADVTKVDAPGELARLGLNDHLSAQRSNGLRAMIERIRQVASNAA